MIKHSLPNNVLTLQKMIKDKEKTIKNKDLQISNNNSRLERLSNQIAQLQEQLKNTVSLDCIPPDVNPILVSFIKTSFQNFDKKPNGNRYDDLMYFYTLLSLYGKIIIQILHYTLNIPHYSTIKRYKKKVYEELDITTSTFDGNIYNIQNIIQLHFTSSIKTKAVLMVDACYVTPYVSVNNNGNIIGMLDTTDIELDEAKKLINDEGVFFEYLKVNKKSVIEAEFVLMVAPLNPAYKPFPVCCLSSNSGAATEETIAAIEKIINILEKIDIKIMGVGTDGDRQYIKYSRHMYQYIIDNIELFYELDILKFQKKRQSNIPLF